MSSDHAGRYRAVRSASEHLAGPLSPEDCTPQSMPDASPVKWHLAHTTWFFETFVLEAAEPDFQPVEPLYREMFNSYYFSIGDRYFRPERGLVTRPSLVEVWAYRREVDRRMERLLDASRLSESLLAVVELGLQHEQQHQELLLTDLKHLLSKNPLHPAYRAVAAPPETQPQPLHWHAMGEELREIGHQGPGFGFDNEGPRHRVYLDAFELGSRLVTNADYLAFMEDGGYRRPELWLSDGWAMREKHSWQAPLYWSLEGDRWFSHTLPGWLPVRADEPVTHVSLYEAAAYARWADARLPTEAEWEVVAASHPVKGNFVENERFHPAPAAAGEAADGPTQLFGDVWEWTATSYCPYPGYQPVQGALGEYNGKFMANQFVLRGGSCATPNNHVRATYRNFFYPDARWQFSGIRLARDA